MIIFLCVMGVLAFLAVLLYVVAAMSTPIPPKIPTWAMYMCIPFAYIVVAIYYVATRNWKEFKNIRNWTF